MATYSITSPDSVRLYFGLGAEAKSIRYDAITANQLGIIEANRNRALSILSTERSDTEDNPTAPGRNQRNYLDPQNHLHWAWNINTLTWILVSATTGPWIGTILSTDITPTPTATISNTPTPTTTVSSTPTPTTTSSPTPTITPEASNTPTLTSTITPTPTIGVSTTPTPTITRTLTQTPTITRTLTQTPTTSITRTITATLTPTISITPTRTTTPTPTTTPSVSTSRSICTIYDISPNKIEFIGKTKYQITFTSKVPQCYYCNKCVAEINLINYTKNTTNYYSFIVPDDTQVCCDCDEDKSFKLQNIFYNTITFDNLIAGDLYLVKSKLSCMEAELTPTPTVTVTVTPTNSKRPIISPTPTITRTATSTPPTVSRTPTVTPTRTSLIPSLTPTVSITRTTTPTPTKSGGGSNPNVTLFDLTSWQNTVPEPYRTYLNAAANRWGIYLTYDINDVSGIRASRPNWNGLALDTFNIINNSNGYIASCGPSMYMKKSPFLSPNISGFLSISFILNVNEYYRNIFSANDWINIMAHELGHALGIGIYWNPALGASGIVPPVGFFLDGYKYLTSQNAYNNITSLTRTLIPLEDQGGSGTASAHWENAFRNASYSGGGGVTHYGLGNELMVGTISPGNSRILSSLSIKCLAEFGYQERNVGASEGIPTLNTSLVMEQQGEFRLGCGCADHIHNITELQLNAQ